MRTVHHSFKHEGVFYTNDNIDKLPEDQVADRVRRGYISDTELGGVGADLSGVQFASVEAAQEAQSRGLTPTSFLNYEPSSENGFTVEDVRSIE